MQKDDVTLYGTYQYNRPVSCPSAIRLNAEQSDEQAYVAALAFVIHRAIEKKLKAPASICPPPKP